jgi:hypothetical protein
MMVPWPPITGEPSCCEDARKVAVREKGYVAVKELETLD